MPLALNLVLPTAPGFNPSMEGVIDVSVPAVALLRARSSVLPSLRQKRRR